VRVHLGTDLGSTTTKAVLLDDQGRLLGRGITNSRSNYHLAADIAREEAFIGARFTLLERELPSTADRSLSKRLRHQFKKQQFRAQLSWLRKLGLEIAGSPARPALAERLGLLFDRLDAEAMKPAVAAPASEFFRDKASSSFAKAAESLADREVPFDDLIAVFDKAILRVENQRLDLGFEANIEAATDATVDGAGPATAEAFRSAVGRMRAAPLDVAASIGTGYGRQRLPFPKDCIRSEILCHGLGAHAVFPGTRTILDIGGQDTKAIQVDGQGIVEKFQMNDRCAAGCGRYLGYIADEMNLGLHELGPLAMQSTRHVKINSTCTVFAGAELRERLTTGERREDILAGLHRAIIIRAMALLSRSGGVYDEFTFTGGVANNSAAVRALEVLVEENYGQRTINISPDSIYMGALGAATFALRLKGGQA
jgi:benzoyl-CoA reductase subunit A